MARLVGPTDLYQAFNDNGEILYVGISHNAITRLRQHRSSSAWWPHATWFQVTRYEERRDAEKAEALVVAFDDPPYNVDRCEGPMRRAWKDIDRGIYNYPSFEEHEFHVSRIGAMLRG